MKTRKTDLKKAFLFPLLITCLCALCSCSSGNQQETFFVHSAVFESNKDDVRITFLLEKHGKEKNGYFTASSSAESIKDAAEKITAKYKDCYFATCDLYFISLSTTPDTISTIAKEICDSNIFPTTGSILCISSESAQSFMSNINNAESIKNIKNDTTKNRVNIASFFARYYSEKPVTIDAFDVKDDKISKIGNATFSRNRKAVLHEDRQR